MLFFDVIGREPVPHDVRRVTGDVIKDGRIDLYIVRRTQKSRRMNRCSSRLCRPFHSPAVLATQLPNVYRRPPAAMICSVRPTFGATR